jgi:hypothetical protein
MAREMSLKERLIDGDVLDPDDSLAWFGFHYSIHQ